MKFRDEYRDPEAARGYADAIARMVTRPWTLMEVCGGQTHAIVRYGIDELLPDGVTLVHGPGCPVCVTPAEYIDKAIEIAGRPEATLCSFGDMLRVPATAATCWRRSRAAATCGWSTRRSTRWPSPAPIPTARWCSSPSASRPPRRPTPWRPTRRSGRG